MPLKPKCSNIGDGIIKIEAIKKKQYKLEKCFLLFSTKFFKNILFYYKDLCIDLKQLHMKIYE